MSSNDEQGEILTLQVNGFAFSALAAGPSAGELLLLLHGFPQFADSWAGAMPALAAAGFRVVAVDQRGYAAGARPGTVSSYALPALVADVLGLADALGAERFHLAGHDWGGAVAWATAAGHPTRLKTLTVLSTPHLDAFAKALAHDSGQKMRSLYMALFRAPGHLAEKTLLALHAKALRGAYEGKVAPEAVERNVARLQKEGALTAALNWYRANTFETAIGAIRVPTLYLWGEQDKALGEAAALDTGSYLAAPYRFVRLPDVSHWLLDEVPETVTRLMLEHLQTSS